MTFPHVIQYTDTAATEEGAREMLAFLAEQVDFRGGRVLAPCWPNLDTHRVQAFFDDADVASKLLPIGCRRVFCPDYLLAVT